MTRLAFLGLGAMGTPMAARLVEAGHEVTVWNRSRERAEPFAGRARIADTPVDAVRDVEAAITMVTAEAALEEVLFRAEGVASAVGPGATLIDMSTIGADAVAAVAARLPEGVELIDAPVLGSVSNAVDGTLKVFVGASEASFERWQDVLAAFGTPMHLGPLGSGAAMKLVANSTLSGMMSIVGEALALADALGLERERSVPVLLGSRIGPALEAKLDKIESGVYDPSFRLSLMLKDARLILDAAERRGVDLRVARAAEDWYERAQASGLGDLDYSAVVAEITGRPGA
ncbi:MAG TPA: NAD(P)-dependent oxidoreductase [Actinomycetota bacterium]|nr:NAD(P)-dependent oxidoreductase [Actinomycetota bacterium]